MGTVRCVGEGGTVWEFDDDIPYVVEQLASGRLRPVDDTPNDDAAPKRGRPRKQAVQSDDSVE